MDSREHLKVAQQYFQLLGASASECDTIPGRQCMALNVCTDTPSIPLPVNAPSYHSLGSDAASLPSKSQTGSDLCRNVA